MNTVIGTAVSLVRVSCSCQLDRRGGDRTPKPAVTAAQASSPAEITPPVRESHDICIKIKLLI
jgi:hypothetical protein